MNLHRLPTAPSRSQWDAVPTTFEVQTQHGSDGSKVRGVRAIFGNTLVKVGLGIVAGSAITLAVIDKVPPLIDKIGEKSENMRRIDASKQISLATIEARSHAQDLKTQIQLAKLEAVKAESVRKTEEIKLEAAKLQRDTVLANVNY